tara:strand:+ start:130 stop:480 length:351 start_codon:yes stop_codon:yes gene_type:complete
MPNSFSVEERQRSHAKKKNQKKRLARPNSAMSLRLGRLGGSCMSMHDLQRFVATKRRIGSQENLRIQPVFGLRHKKTANLSVDGDGLKTRQALAFVERMGGIKTRLTGATKRPKMR